jgi:hypothetical protein
MKNWLKGQNSLFILGLIFITSIPVKGQTGTFINLGPGTVRNISPNGKYISGSLLNQGYIYDLEQAEFNNIKGSTDVRAVNNKGHAAVMFYDSSYMRIATGGSVATPITNGGVYRNDTIYSVGLGRRITIPADAVPPANLLAIDSNSNVYGSTFLYNSSSKIAPFVWKYNGNNYITDTAAFTYLNPVSTDQGGTVAAVSQNGQVAGGWISQSIYRGRRMAALWTRPDTTAVMLSETVETSAGGKVSPNGKYFITKYEGNAAIYDIEKKELTVFGPVSSTPSSVSDNGFVIGDEEVEVTLSDGSITTTRLGFIWSDKLGYMLIRDFIDKYLPDMEIPATDNQYFTFENNVSTTPMAISQDGLIIAGYSAFSQLDRRAWVIQISEALDLIDRPHNLTATVDVPMRNTVNLSWTEPEAGSHSLDKYYIYRNGEYLDQINATITSYTDNNAPTGQVSYSVSAIYDFVNSTDFLESPQTDIAKVIIVNNYDIPFTENFESGSFNPNYWTVDYDIKGTWALLDIDMPVNGQTGVFFYVHGDKNPYNASITSKPLDAKSKDKVILSFTHAITTYPDNLEFIGIRDTVSIEVRNVDSDEWIVAKRILLDRKLNWEAVTADISAVAANKLFQVRFRAVSGSNRNHLAYKLDNIGISFESPAAPTDVIAIRNANGGDIRVMYKDATGSYGFSYGTGSTNNMRVGSEQTSIIAVNRFTANELAKMKDKYLSSISAYLFADIATDVSSQLKLAVFVNGERVESSEIQDWQGNTWNNFQLPTPIALNGTDEVLVGIEAICNGIENRPLSMNNGDFHVDTLTGEFEFYGLNTNGNMYSEDGGLSWHNTHEASNYSQGLVFSGHWDIIANIRDENTAATPDDDFRALRYEIYRNETKLEAFHYGQYFIDKTSVSNDDCYSVKEFSISGGMSPMSQEGCTEVLEIVSISNPATEAEKVFVYPNPTSAIVTIEANVKIVSVYNMQGKLVARVNTQKVDMRTLPNGTYILEIVTDEGRVTTTKVIKK